MHLPGILYHNLQLHIIQIFLEMILWIKVTHLVFIYNFY